MRDKSIDILKFIGIMCIILAHVNTPDIIFQLRNFDVVLMIMVSALLFFCKTKNWNIKEYCDYIVKRIKRLIIPTWIFLTIFFCILTVLNIQNVSKKYVIQSYLLNDGIDYFWVIRVYFILAILLPICQTCIIKNEKVFSISSLLLYICYEILYYFGFFRNGAISYLFVHLIPIIVIIAVTNWMRKAHTKSIVIFSVINFFVFILCALIIYKNTGQFENTNYMKYPFRLYYLSYAFAGTGMLISVFRVKSISEKFYNSFINFVSCNSLWIYLGHTIYIIILDKYVPSLMWLLRYIIVLAVTLLTIYAKNMAVRYIDKYKIGKSISWLFKG